MVQFLRTLEPHRKCPIVRSASGASSSLTTIARLSGIAFGLATTASLHFWYCRLLQGGALTSTHFAVDWFPHVSGGRVDLLFEIARQ